MLQCLLFFSSLNLAFGSTILWDGRFNDMTSSTELESWSWSNQVGPYQYYIVCFPAQAYELLLNCS